MSAAPTHADNPPPGFVESTGRGPFTRHNGPFFHLTTDDGFRHGFRVKERHCNGHGIVHGGLLMAFADGLLGTAVWRAVKGPSLTVRMTSDFLSIGKPGDWIEGAATVTRATRTIAFVRGEVSVGQRVIMTADGVFKIMERRRATGA